MTIQLASPEVGKSKATLKAALESNPAAVRFYDPSIMGERHLTGATWAEPAKTPVVLDHPKRMRFAQITKRADGTWKVE